MPSLTTAQRPTPANIQRPALAQARRPALTLALTTLAAAASALLMSTAAQASSHREAPFIATQPKVDATDLYLFNSYEAGRSNFVTLIANYQPLQDAYGGPNYFKLDPNALYEIHVDNTGDGKEDITFQFKFQNDFKAIKVPVGNKMVAIPLTQAGSVSDRNAPALNVNEKYSVTVVRGDRRTGAASMVTGTGGITLFDKPVDNIGTKTIPDYPAYAAKHIYSVSIPGCATPAKMFVGQRQDPFAVNLGTIFDLINAPLSTITNPALINAVPNTIGDKNVTTLALEIDKACLVAPGANDPVIGAWTTASLRQSALLNATPPSGHQTSASYGGGWVQVSRLGMPLVNEVVIGLPDKDKFNGSRPMGDGQFADYVTNPTLPVLVEVAYATTGLAPTNLPRLDLVTTFLTGIPGVNRPKNVVASEMMRLNTAIPAVSFAQQNRLGIVGEILRVGGPQNLGQAVDLAGYPNGRRPKDDVVDISLVAVMGGLCMANGAGNALGFGTACNPGAVPLGATAFTLHDAVDQAVVPLLAGFPYLNTPLPGAK